MDKSDPAYVLMRKTLHGPHVARPVEERNRLRLQRIREVSTQYNDDHYLSDCIVQTTYAVWYINDQIKQRKAERKPIKALLRQAARIKREAAKLP